MPSRKLEDACKELQIKIPKIKGEFELKFPGWNLLIVCTHRTPEEQMEEFKKGRAFDETTKEWKVVDRRKKVTNCDGIIKVSKHNRYPSDAVDIALQTPKRDLFYKIENADKTVEEHWAYITELAKIYSLNHGGTWKDPVDYPHLEVWEKKK